MTHYVFTVHEKTEKSKIWRALYDVLVWVFYLSYCTSCTYGDKRKIEYSYNDNGHSRRREQCAHRIKRSHHGYN